jgi:hypothetical protein
MSDRIFAVTDGKKFIPIEVAEESRILMNCGSKIMCALLRPSDWKKYSMKYVPFRTINNNKFMQNHEIYGTYISNINDLPPNWIVEHIKTETYGDIYYATISLIMIAENIKYWYYGPKRYYGDEIRNGKKYIHDEHTRIEKKIAQIVLSHTCLPSEIVDLICQYL